MEQQESAYSTPINIPVSSPAPTDSMNESIVESSYQVELNVSCDRSEQESSRIDGNTTKITADAEGIIPVVEASKSDSDSGESGAKNDDVPKSPVVTEDVAASNSKNENSSIITCEGNELKSEIESKVTELVTRLMDLVGGQSLIYAPYHSPGDDKNIAVLENIIKMYSKPSVASPVRPSTSKSSDSRSESPSVSPEDSFLSHKVHISEAEVPTNKNEGRKVLSRYEENLRKFLDGTELRKKLMSRKAPISEENSKSVESEQGETLLKQTVKSDGTVSNIIYLSGDMNRITSVLLKMKIGETSSSAPSSFNDNASNYDASKSLHSETMIKKGKRLDTHLPSNNAEGASTLTDLTKCESKGETELNPSKLVSVASVSNTCVSLTSSSKSPQSVFSCKSSDCFKVPMLPRRSGKSPKSQINKSPKLGLSPETSQMGSENLHTPPSVSPRRPTTLSLSPRTSFFVFRPGGPTDIFRQCYSLPNVSLVPKKEDRRSSMNFENANRSVKALFTGEYKSKTPESSVSSVAIEKVKKAFLSAHIEAAGSNDESKSDSKEHILDTKCASESLVSNALNKSRIRKKLNFVSQSCDYTETLTLQDSTSSSSQGLSSNVSNLQITDSTTVLGPEITVSDSLSPKRKIENIGQLVPTCSKRLRTFSNPDAYKATEVVISPRRDDKFEEIKTKHSYASTDDVTEGLQQSISDSTKSSIKCDVASTSGATGSKHKILASSPVIQFPGEEAEDESIPRTLKIAQELISESVEGIADSASDSKTAAASRHTVHDFPGIKSADEEAGGAPISRTLERAQKLESVEGITDSTSCSETAISEHYTLESSPVIRFSEVEAEDALVSRTLKRAQRLIVDSVAGIVDSASDSEMAAVSGYRTRDSSVVQFLEETEDVSISRTSLKRAQELITSSVECCADIESDTKRKKSE